MGITIGFFDSLVLRKLVGIKRDLVGGLKQRREACRDPALQRGAIAVCRGDLNHQCGELLPDLPKLVAPGLESVPIHFRGRALDNPAMPLKQQIKTCGVEDADKALRRGGVARRFPWSWRNRSTETDSVATASRDRKAKQ